VEKGNVRSREKEKESWVPRAKGEGTEPSLCRGCCGAELALGGHYLKPLEKEEREWDLPNEVKHGRFTKFFQVQKNMQHEGVGQRPEQKRKSFKNAV